MLAVGAPLRLAAGDGDRLSVHEKRTALGIGGRGEDGGKMVAVRTEDDVPQIAGDPFKHFDFGLPIDYQPRVGQTLTIVSRMLSGEVVEMLAVGREKNRAV